jgi:hypothetical protein
MMVGENQFTPIVLRIARPVRQQLTDQFDIIHFESPFGKGHCSGEVPGDNSLKISGWRKATPNHAMTPMITGKYHESPTRQCVRIAHHQANQ